MLLRSIALTLLASTSLLGCSNSGPKVVPAGGTIKTLSGAPCKDAFIVFHPLEKARLHDPKPLANADESGNFTLRTFTMDDGAAPGEYGVTIVWADKSSNQREFSISGEGSAAATDRLGGKYGNPKDPKIKVTIPAEGNKSISLQVDG